MDLVPTARQRAIIALTMLLFVLLVAFLFAGPSPRNAASAAGEAGGSEAAAGQTIYSGQCAGCHGARLEGAPGQGPNAALNAGGDASRRDDEWLFQVIKHGAEAAPEEAEGMPAMGNSLSDADIRAVIAYLREQWASAPSR